MSSEETPPLHFRLKPKIPLKLRSFISGLRAALRAVGLRNAPAGAVLSPPDPLRWAPAGAPVFGCAEKRKPSRGPSRRFAAHLGGPCTVLVVAKSAKLRFRLTAKTAPAPLLLLSPPDPLRWAPAGAPIKSRWGENLPVWANFAQMRGSSQTVPGNLPLSIRLRLTAYRPLALCRSCDCHRGCFASLTQGPLLRFPRFAHGRSRLGGILLLFPRKAPACAQAQKEGVNGYKLLCFLVADCEVGLQTIFQQ